MAKLTIKASIRLTLPLAIAILGVGLFVSCGLSADQEVLEKSSAVCFLEEVANINLSAYKMTLEWETTPSAITDYFYPGRVQTSVNAHLSNSNSEFDALIEFVEGKFYSYSLNCLKQGTLATKSQSPSDPVVLAKSSLVSYGLSFNATYCKQLARSLDMISEISEQQIQTDDAVLTVKISGKTSTSFAWRYRIGDLVSSDKQLVIAIDETRFLFWFRDSWGLYKTRNAGIKVSSEEAISTALSVLKADVDRLNASGKSTVEEIQKQINEEGAKIAGSKASLRFSKLPSDCFTINAAWFVEVSYDKAYSYHMTGFGVYLWADTGQIYKVIANGYYGGGDGQNGTSESPSPSIYWLVVAALPAVIIPTALMLQRKHKHLRSRIDR